MAKVIGDECEEAYQIAGEIVEKRHQEETVELHRYGARKVDPPRAVMRQNDNMRELE